MQYAHLGRSGLKVSRLALGTMNFGYLTDQREAENIMDAAVDNGINLFDSADIYGTRQYPEIPKGTGISEEIIGNWIKNSGKRDKIVLATKLYQPMDYGVNDRHLSAYHIRRACEASLKRLNTDHIDLYQMHHIDRGTPWDEIWEAMDVLIKQGKISYVGSSNFAGWHIATAQENAKNRHMLGLVSEQDIYNLKNRAIETEVIPACRYHGVGLILWSPLDSGLLAGALDKFENGRRSDLKNVVAQYHDQLVAYENLCKELHEKPADIALAWCLANPVVTAPILGPRTKTQLEENLRAVDISLSKEVLTKLDQIWPGPNGEAPEAYAW